MYSNITRVIVVVWGRRGVKMFLKIYFIHHCILIVQMVLVRTASMIHDPLMYPSITEIMLKQPAAPAGQSFSPFNHSQKGKVRASVTCGAVLKLLLLFSPSDGLTHSWHQS